MDSSFGTQWFGLLLLVFLPFCISQNMVPGNYLLANAYPGYENAKYRGHWFEMYSEPISTKYSEVYWHLQPLIPLPDKIVQQFNNSVIAITGYEVDIVRKDPNGGPDIPVPAYEQYNHHYAAWILDNSSVAVNDEMSHDHFEMSPASRYSAKPGGRSGDTSIPLIQYFSEGNGGEMRLSFHGYPQGTAQLVDSPTHMKLTPMMINTKSPTGVRGGPLPISNNIWPTDAVASGLIECPCTTRISKTPAKPVTQISGKCSSKTYTTAQDCFKAAVDFGINATSNSTQASSTLPANCTFHTFPDNTTVVTFNTNPNSTVACGSGSSANAKGQTQSINNLKLELDAKAGTVTITIAGQDGVWFGVGFNASLMADQPYAIVVDGYGAVTERKLAEHDPGVQLASTVTVVSNTVSNGTRTVQMTRSLVGKDVNYYTFSLQVGSINFINAVGSTPDLSYHFNRTGSVINLMIGDADICLCPGHGGNVNGLPFGENCKPEPYSDLLVQNNPTCFWETFNGGLQCCYDGDFLLDAEQTIPPTVDTYFMKFRWYYETYDPVTVSHRNLVHLYWQTEAWQGEYDITQCPKGTPSQECVHTITSHFSLRDLLPSTPCDERHNPDCIDINQVGDKGMNLIYAAAHCHAPMCIDLELYDESTGTLLCRNYPVWGNSDKVYDEKGYIAGIPPCEWGSASEGLPPPPVLYLDTPLFSIKRANSTYMHYGDMASWQMRGAYIN